MTEHTTDIAAPLDDFFAFLPSGQFLHVPTRGLWPAKSVNARTQNLNAAEWLRSHRPLDGMTWAPGEPFIIRDKIATESGWKTQPGCVLFNLYQPPPPGDGNPDDVQPWLNHLEFLYPDQVLRDHITFYQAHVLQRPHTKINHALVIGGSQGIGKDSLFEPLRHGVGPGNWLEVSPRDLIEGQFNDFARAVVLRINELRDLGDNTRNAFYDHCKPYLSTPPNMLRVNQKYQPACYVPNVCAPVFTTNYRDAMFVADDDRRLCLAWSPRLAEDFPKDYFENLWTSFRDGGTANVVAYLMGLDLGSFDPTAPPPKTETWHNAILVNHPIEDDELRDVLDELLQPDAVTVETIAFNAPTEFRDWLKDRKNATKIPHRLDACGYAIVRNPDAKADGRWRIGGKKRRVYAKIKLSDEQRINAAQALT
jgi:hypothetical protein